MKLIVTKYAQAQISIGLSNKKQPSVYLEIFKPIKEKKYDDGKTVPVFYDAETNKKDSKVCKLSLSEISNIIDGLKVFKNSDVKNRAEAFKTFAIGTIGKDALMFTHKRSDDSIRYVSLQPISSKDDVPPTMYLSIYDKGASSYKVSIPYSEISGVIRKLEVTRDLAISYELGSNDMGQKQKKAVTAASAEDVEEIAASAEESSDYTPW